MKKLATVALTALLTAVPFAADAHYVNAYHGYDMAWVGAHHHRAGIQDRECDGNKAYIEVVYQVGGRQARVGWYDRNGCRAGGTARRLPKHAQLMHACELASNFTCTNWKKV